MSEEPAKRLTRDQEKSLDRLIEVMWGPHAPETSPTCARREAVKELRRLATAGLLAEPRVARPAVTGDTILSTNLREVRCKCGLHRLGEVPDAFSGRWHGVTKCDP